MCVDLEKSACTEADVFCATWENSEFSQESRPGGGVAPPATRARKAGRVWEPGRAARAGRPGRTGRDGRTVTPGRAGRTGTAGRTQKQTPRSHALPLRSLRLWSLHPNGIQEYCDVAGTAGQRCGAECGDSGT
eukprot:gene16352-biopygen2241